MTELSLEPAADHLSSVERLLAENDLPTDDVRANLDAFYVARQNGERIGVGGIEQYGTDGLLRSVVVEASVQGQGLGAALTDRLERKARTDGIGRLYLLTTTAAEFFAARGYEETERESAPASIRRTTQFDSLCPAAATCLKKSL